MNKMSRVKWQELEDAFLSGNLDDAEFCKSKNLNLEWFRQELSKSELQETPGRKAGGDRLFVELLPQVETPGLTGCGSLKLKFRGVELEYGNGAGEEILRQALRVIREEL